MNILRTYTQTSGCITIGIGLALTSGMATLPSDCGRVSGLSSDTGIITATNKLSTSICADIDSNTNMSIQILKNETTISCGLVCTVGTESFLILCSSDADLLTIDGEYLTITRY